MGYTDLHIHTVYSWDAATTVRAALKQAADEGLDVVAITDHDEITGALEAREMASHFGIEVIPGVEISTRDGHLLALFVEQAPPRGWSLEDSLLWVGDQGGLGIIAHPFSPLPDSPSLEMVLHILTHSPARSVIKGIETHNAATQAVNARVQKLADYLPLAKTAGSDSHVFYTIGMGRTYFPGSTSADLRLALEQATTVPVVTKKFSPTYLFSWTRRMILRAMGYASDTLSATMPIHTRPVLRAALSEESRMGRTNPTNKLRGI
jgi:hypothetical protein